MTGRTTRLALLAVCPLLLGATQPDPDNPTCPKDPQWGDAAVMELWVEEHGGKKVLIANGIIDESLPQRLKQAIEGDDQIAEIWLQSRGGHARAGNDAGRIIRSYPGLATRIPSGWTCFSACNFVFMGGRPRFVEPGGIFMVHMFTHTKDRWIINEAVLEGTGATTELIADIEQQSALLASEDNDFLIRMGISRKLLTDIMYRQQAVKSDRNPSTRYCLSQDEVREFNVMNVPG